MLFKLQTNPFHVLRYASDLWSIRWHGNPLKFCPAGIVRGCTSRGVLNSVTRSDCCKFSETLLSSIPINLRSGLVKPPYSMVNHQHDGNPPLCEFTAMIKINHDQPTIESPTLTPTVLVGLETTKWVEKTPPATHPKKNVEAIGQTWGVTAELYSHTTLSRI